MISSTPAIAYRHPRPFPVLVLREQIAREPETAADWKAVHERLVALGKQRASHERDLARWLLAAERLRAHTRAGYASLREYAERVVGLNGRQTEERLRVARALRALPVLDAALACGELLWSAVRELTRIATRETEAAWLAWARSRRARQVEKAVAARRPGEGPSARPDPSIVKHRLSFEVRAETIALFRDFQAKRRAEHGGAVDDDTLLYELVRGALGGPGDDARAGYQIAFTRCDGCGRTTIEAGGESHPVDEHVGEMAGCDAQEIPRAPHVGASRATQTIPPAVRRLVLRRDHKRCVFPGCTNHIYLDVHHLDSRADGGGHDPDRLACLCGSHHRAVHAAALCIEGTASDGFVFRHADGTPYGAPVTASSMEIARQVLGALESMGFKATQARAFVDEALRTGAADDTPALLRAALRASR